MGVVQTGLLAFGTLGVRNYLEKNKGAVPEGLEFIQEEYLSEISFFLSYAALYPIDSIK